MDKVFQIAIIIFTLVFIPFCSSEEEESTDDESPNVINKKDESPGKKDGNDNENQNENDDAKKDEEEDDEENENDDSEVDSKTIKLDNKSPIAFDMVDTSALIALNTIASVDSSSESSAGTLNIPGLVMNKYGLVRAEGSSRQGGSNLLATTKSGKMKSIIDSDYNIMVRYSVVDPKGEYAYLALKAEMPPGPGWWDSPGRLVMTTGCGFWKIKLSDNTVACFAQGWHPEGEMGAGNHRFIPDGSEKMLSFDRDGKIYFYANEFRTCEPGRNTPLEWPNLDDFLAGKVKPSKPGGHSGGHPGSYQKNDYHLTSGQTKSTLQANGFSPCGSGNRIVYRYDPMTDSVSSVTAEDMVGEEKVVYFRTTPTGHLLTYGILRTENNQYVSRLDLLVSGTQTPTDFSGEMTNVMKYLQSDSHKGYIWDFNGKLGLINISDSGTVESTGLSLGPIFGAKSLFRTIVADDGKIYALVKENNNIHLYSLMPFDEEPVVTIALIEKYQQDGGSDWVLGPVFSSQNKTIIQPIYVAGGHVFHLTESGDNHDIKVTKISDKSQHSMLTGKGRFLIQNWNLRADELHFAATNLDRNVVVTGVVDVKKLSEGASSDTYLTLSDLFSTQGASDAAVKDITVVKAKTVTPTGTSNPTVSFIVDEDKPFVLSFNFSQAMDRSSVEDALSVTIDGQSATGIKLWAFNTLHFIPDTDGLSNDTTPSLEDNKPVVASFSSGAKDSSGRALTGTTTFDFTTGSN